ncbi:MAG: hypothetical protein LUQ31_04100 [Methanoregula sp.]|nr:hypothetical protein [Methanoregula sp.]
MAGLNEDAQWIVLMGFIVSFSFFFLAMVLNQSTVVGQTTAEGVLEFPKNDIRDVKNIIIQSAALPDQDVVRGDISAIALSRKGAVVNYTVTGSSGSDTHTYIEIHFNNGVTEYNEFWTSP